MIHFLIDNIDTLFLIVFLIFILVFLWLCMRRSRKQISSIREDSKKMHQASLENAQRIHREHTELTHICLEESKKTNALLGDILERIAQDKK